MYKPKTVYQRLTDEADFALQNKSLTLAHEAYGAAKMAFNLDAITKEQFFELNTKLVRNGINNAKAGLA